ncbi:MAG TPA: hypothetical protein VEV83_08005 [Parafilimonas sp.]|nr:hypothetical protein [Parafilimonas sp.]
MHLLIFLAFTILELAIVIAIIAIILAIALPNLLSAPRASKCLELAAEIRKELEEAKDIATKMYNGDTTTTDEKPNHKLDSVTGKLKRLKEHCGEKDHSTIISQLNQLTAQLRLYISGDVPPEQNSIVQTFIDGFVDLAKKLAK